ncbi:MAG: DUF1329 domain-containing protein [Thiotrichaceae bacterium]|nr:DUF1329 domain-containing protein [Thiotrichaceae bacterium]PCI11838.1 MAG: outer membrane lipoprotein-sorting protein [Thiotrichales bacterium]
MTTLTQYSSSKRFSTSRAVSLLLAMTLSTLSATAMAQPSAAEIARLGNDLTPMGAIKAGNSDGTIPPWEGGITTPPAGYKKGDHHPDPFADDKIRITITQDNMAEHSDKLSAGHQAMLAAYDSFYINVYPTHRSAAAPQRIYDAAIKNASRATLTENGNGVTGAEITIPFPIPASGLEAIWNHVLRWRGVTTARHFSQAAPNRNGDYTLVKFYDEFNMQYAKEGMTEEKLNNITLHFKQQVLAPPRLAGGILLVHDTMDQFKEPRKAWLYNPGQRRVRRAPNVAFDNPGTASDGMRTTDQYDMFTGSPERYDWELVGRKEIYVPYNSYKLHSDDLKYDDILKPLHINPEHLRYELHRVWVVEATVKEGMRHLYKRRTFYIDEDSWQILLVDQYDNRDQLWRVSEGHVINYYEMPMLWTTLEVHTDLQAGRYLAFGLDNEDKMYEFGFERSAADYTPAALRRAGRR